ncbi:MULTISPECIES: acyl carrier protein [unclassified Streptomyces]|uniref:Acyl carrier protein n=3 Tax=Streptomyces TaxID=1883 RepID=A0ABU2QVS9_9ACTN|nr:MULTISPECIES: acyl carrier protein [unclassified Streptomyces]AAC18105.1 acyl carrier protein [Streptomyces roseofulvus]EFL03691.1 acyl carrier protein [Streptomyces sp. SPB78]MDT0408548.1 acyl carrier protein [Streptomyces sp. DSM 41979]MDT0422244.1 acyl carrier protein [Streptomyces sp. DSM 41859]MYQ58714.1 acyl carrier protein [Streptomyces sp. SID4926]
MSAFTLTEFKKLVEQSYDAESAEALHGQALDTSFTDLGYDSLTVYEIVTRIQDEHGVTVPDEELDLLDTPRALIAYVDARAGSRT